MLFLSLILPSIQPVSAQPAFSYNGFVHTPKGDLHILVVFVRYHNRSLMSNAGWPDETAPDKLPDMAKGEINRLFNTDPKTIGTSDQIANLSDYYYKMSNETFRITADIFPVQVPVTYLPSTINSNFNRQLQMNEMAIKWITENYPDFDWSKYDNRTNNPNFNYDNSQSRPDSIIDYIVFMHRAQGNQGAGTPGSFPVPNTPFKINAGHTGVQSYASAPHNWLFFRHEFAHNLYRSPHYLGANSADGLRFFTQKGWGLMAAWHAPFFTTNAWEKWWLGWMEPQEITVNGTYNLQDMMTGRDAIRIAIPGTKDYLWIENHQKKEPYWDKKQFFNSLEQRQPESAPGIYMYVVAEPGTDRSSPRLSPFNKRHANFIKMYNAEGNFDIKPTGDKLFNGFFESTVMKKAQPNPFSGQNDFQFIRGDYNGDGKLEVNFAHGNRDRGSGENRTMWAEQVKRKNILTFGNTGDGNDAFLPGDEVGLSGIVPVTHFPEYLSTKQTFEPYLLSGLGIKVRQGTDGAMLLDVQFDDWEVRKDQRWCGNLRLPNMSSLNDKYLVIAEKSKVSLSLSKTPDRMSPHPETGTFSNPTKLLVESQRGIRLSKKSELHIEPQATIELAGASEIVVQQGATLHVEGSLILSNEARLIVERKGRLILDPEAKLVLGSINQLAADPKSRVKDNRMP